ncbi:hypothetical protein [Campylobacter corcagiensis]|uniref:Uncharacterized protein n=1 Tax=Campylobacter corcagiensis TaxID=1448857 RepID=A0A7M1LFJ4_9BACT|nr:hypothetical protein [Campylobacter corcagiensis]QKF64442.1 putative membrane protein [Campylobacter corcagiensis]QOQ87372.1 hypothetical protein IMC76_00710 [Campylobacter corcagiensis]
MRKILLLILALVLLFGGIFILSNEAIRKDLKIISFLVLLIVYIISLVVIAIGEKDVVKEPLMSAMLIALVAGFMSGFFISSKWYIVGFVISLYVGLVVALQVKFQTFSNKTYKIKSDIDEQI